MDDCNWAIDVHPLFAKAHVRRSQAHEQLQQLEEALRDMSRVQQLQPQWPGVGASVARLTKLHDAKMEVRPLLSLHSLHCSLLYFALLCSDHPI